MCTYAKPSRRAHAGQIIVMMVEILVQLRVPRYLSVRVVLEGYASPWPSADLIGVSIWVRDDVKGGKAFQGLGHEESRWSWEEQVAGKTGKGVGNSCPIRLRRTERRCLLGSQTGEACSPCGVDTQAFLFRSFTAAPGDPLLPMVPRAPCQN